MDSSYLTLPALINYGGAKIVACTEPNEVVLFSPARGEATSWIAYLLFGSYLFYNIF